MWGRVEALRLLQHILCTRHCSKYKHITRMDKKQTQDIKHSLPAGVVPSVDIIRSHLREEPESNIIYFKRDINVITTDLSKYDERCGVMPR